MPSERNSQRVSTGVEGLDAILSGGLAPGHPYLVLGAPGTGKTTLALQFALEGARRGERVLFASISQSAGDLRRIAASHGWSLDDIDIEELIRGTEADPLTTRQTVLHPADVELSASVDALAETLEEVRPARLVFDSVGVLKTLAAGDTYRYHTEVTALVRLIQQHQATSLIIGAAPQEDGSSDDELQTLVHGVIRLVRSAPVYGSVRRSVQVEKSRATAFHTGWHNYSIETGGIAAYPRLNVFLGQAKPFREPKEVWEEAESWEYMESGIEELDEMLGGGFEFGTSGVIVGATGTGKSTLAMVYAHAALRQGRNAAVFLFTERPRTFVRRASDLSMDVRPFLKDGRLHLQTVDVGELSPGAFADRLRSVVDAGAEVVIIDSLTGYFHAMLDEALLQVQMHDILSFIASRGVLGLLIVDQHGLVGREMMAPVDISYMCDSLIVMRNYDEGGRVRRAMAVVKKRYGRHDMTVRELEVTGEGLRIGEPRHDLIGVLSGSPQIVRRSERRNNPSWEKREQRS